MTGRRRGQPAPLRVELVAGGLLVGAVLFLAGLALAISTALTPTPPAPPAVTRRIPGPTVTISYLIEVTVTPGVNGF